MYRSASRIAIAAGPLAAGIEEIRPSKTGRFQLRDLAPGDYAVFAWQYLRD